jgi:hypothetical protein
MTEEFRYVQARGTIYLPGSTHGFKPGAILALPRETAEALDQAGHLHTVSDQPPPAASS